MKCHDAHIITNKDKLSKAGLTTDLQGNMCLDKQINPDKLIDREKSFILN